MFHLFMMPALGRARCLLLSITHSFISIDTESGGRFFSQWLRKLYDIYFFDALLLSEEVAFVFSSVVTFSFIDNCLNAIPIVPFCA